MGANARGDFSDYQAFVDETGTSGITQAVDDDGSIWDSYEIRSQPAFAFVNDDGTVDSFLGTLGEAGLTERIDTLIAS